MPNNYTKIDMAKYLAGCIENQDKKSKGLVKRPKKKDHQAIMAVFKTVKGI